MSTSSPPPVSTVSVEYAKSGRSICKGCSVAIASGAVRLGTSTPDPRGFDATKWYHVSCFPSASRPLGPIEGIAGFDSIKDHDLEELRELEKNHERDHTPVGPLEKPSPKKAKTQISSPGEGGPDKDHDCNELRELEKNHKRDHTAVVDPLEEPSPKKVKTQISSSGEGVPDKETISVEYAKSARSTCKGCSKNIAKGALRLGVSFHDPRGFESTKWYHVACFPTSSYTIPPVENLKGFDLIEDKDRDKLRELKENHKRDISAAGQLDEPNLEKEMELPAGHKTIGTLIPFSVSDIKRTYKDATLPAHWKAFKTVIFREQVDGLHASAKIAAFDFDGCLAKTDVRSTGADKWSLQHKSIPEKFQRLYDDGYKLVIFTNESNIERWKNKRQQAVDSKVGRLDNFIECVKVPIQVFIACGLGKGKSIPDDQYRKPNPGMWWLMAQHFNSGIKIDMDQSFYVGDAAGREKDHSDADIKFAKAIGLKFHVPEEYFG